MQSFILSFLVWTRTMFLMSTSKKGFSAKEMQRQLGLKRYKLLWAMIHCAEQRENVMPNIPLEGMIEMDEDYFKVESSEIEQ